MKKKVIKTILIIIVVVYAAMLFDTNSLMKQVRAAFSWEIDRSETTGKPINAYNYDRSNRGEVLGKVHLTLVRLFVLHNFHDGYIWAYYSYGSYNEAGELISGSWNILTKWKIHKENGQWEIVEIVEAP